ncbi:hypothetical protein AV530_002697 [Patagioenas fasciata monilis]|uniref:Uncharacterized protein n=1 Tax=Patagioenas fasciata monilis TaxID=372326 RepID=A0A1V4IPR2_PATFA|nr:hypothetical protein AV530_002697 [Patagioenas fasciata monilis]
MFTLPSLGRIWTAGPLDHCKGAGAGGNMLKEKHQSEKEILWAKEKQKEPIPKEGKDLDTEAVKLNGCYLGPCSMLLS